jgi:hypothetical protein
MTTILILLLAVSMLPAQTLLFSSGFEASSTLAPITLSAGGDDYQRLSGLDTGTGYSWPMSFWGANATTTGLHPIVGGSNLVSTYITNDIESVAGHTGSPTKALKIGSSTPGPGFCCTQVPFQIAGLSQQVKDFYVRYWTKLNPEFLAQEQVGGNNFWRTMLELKTFTDYRIATFIYGASNLVPYWAVVVDNKPEGAGPPCPTGACWTGDNSSIPVPTGQWMLMEYYLHRSIGSDGRFFWAVNGQTIVDHSGPTYGANQENFDFLAFLNVYGTNMNPAYQWVDDIQVWTLPPCGTLPCGSTSVYGISFDGIGDSSVRVSFNVSSSFNALRIRYGTSSCSGGSGGIVQTSDTSTAPSVVFGMTAALSGLAPSTLYHACPEVSSDGGSTWSSGTDATFTTLPRTPVLPPPPPAGMASMTSAGLTFAAEQQAATIPGLNFIDSIPHIAAEESWITTFTLVNKSGTTAQARLSLFGDGLDSSGNGPLLLPLVFPQRPSAPGPLLVASLDLTLAGNASLIVSTAGPQTPPVLVGSAQLATTGAMDGFAILHHVASLQEAVVPMETRNASSYLLAFDNTNGLLLGVSVENVTSQNAVIEVVIRDDTGVQISAPGATISVGPNGHRAFVLSDPAQGFPVTANKRGTIEFDTPAGGQISVLGIRFTPQVAAQGAGSMLTTVPPLANVGTGGGSFAFIASGGDGWQTTFVLVNAGNSAAPATLSFLDPNGNPLPLPISYSQQVGSAVSTVSSVSQMLPAGATLLVQSAGAANLLTGSAQLSTTGHVSGFAVFRHNGQEAVVPLESRNASAYVLPFDNTSGIATGVAINNVSGSAQPVNIPVVIRDDSGSQLALDALPLAANGNFAGDLAQFSSTLGKILFPETANIRGTIEFDAPVGVQIGVIGIRTPSSPAPTYTSVPAFAK